MERLPLSLQEEKRTLRDNQSTFGIMTNLWDDLIMTSQGLPGNLQGLTTGLVTMIEKERGACNNRHMKLGNQVHTCSDQVVITTSAFAHLQN